MSGQQDSALGSGGESLPSDVTSQTGGQPNSVDIEALLANPKFLEFVERKVQGTKDRRIAEQEKQIGGLREQLKRLETLQSEGWSREQALRLMELDDRLESQPQQGKAPVKSEGAAGTSTVVQGFDVDVFLRSVGIDPNDPLVTEFYRQGNVTPDGLITLVTKVKTAPQAKPAQVAPMGGGTTPKEDLWDRYRKERDAARSQDEVIAIRDRYRREHGLEL